MKKSIAALSVAAVLSLGLGSLPANADPYTGTVPTSGEVKAPKTGTPGKANKLKFSVDASGNVAPTGKVIFVVKSKNGKGTFFKVEKYYNGGKLTVFTGGLPKGKYKVKTKFIPNPNSVFKGDIDTTTLTVK